MPGLQLTFSYHSACAKFEEDTNDLPLQESSTFIALKDVRLLCVNIDSALIFEYDLHEHVMQLKFRELFTT